MIALRAFPVATSVVPTVSLLGGMISKAFPYCLLTHRAVLVQLLQAGAPKTLLFVPPAFAPNGEVLPRKTGAASRLERLTRRTSKAVPDLAEGLAAIGLTLEAIDYVASPSTGELDASAVASRFPRARILSADGDRRIGDGVFLLRAPGVRADAQSLVAHGAGGIWVVSANGVTADDWSPLESRMPGVAASARHRDVDVAGTPPESTVRAVQVASMALERTIADRLPRAPGFVQVFPLAELTPSVLAPRLRPTVRIEALEEGPIVYPRGRRSSPPEVSP